PGLDHTSDSSIGIRVEHVPRQRAHFRFIARERAAGPAQVREAINREIKLFEHELATDLARLPGTAAWSSDDLRILSGLIVTAMVATAEAILRSPGRPDIEKQIVEDARVQLRMVLVGALNWRSRS
ncbi:MAG: TetR family transcriptional regulator, partial [Nocardioides sp.]|nr:TetR family transcriptional regulator [Nocardioides sp.]